MSPARDMLDAALDDQVLDLTDPQPGTLGHRERQNLDIDHLLAEHRAATRTLRRYRDALRTIGHIGDDTSAAIAHDTLGGHR